LVEKLLTILEKLPQVLRGDFLTYTVLIVKIGQPWRPAGELKKQKEKRKIQQS